MEWAEKYLLQPDGPDAGEPWHFTNEQARFFLWWFALDERDRFRYRYGMLRRCKGWGKDPLAAVIAAVEFIGPCRFGGTKRDGSPWAVPHNAAWIQIAAVSKEQTKNTMTLFPSLFSPDAIADYGLDIGKEIIYANRGKARIEAVTSSPRSLEGQRASLCIKNESHHWLDANEGTAMSEVIARNAAKSRDGASRVLAISNAHAPGEGSDAERDWEAWQKLVETGKAEDSDFLYDSLEPAPIDSLDDEEAVRMGLEVCRGDSIWLDLDRLGAEIADPRTSEALKRRFYLNQLHANEDRAFDAAKWAASTINGHVVADGAPIALGFDGSVNDDWTVLIGTEVETGYQWPVGIWKPRLNEEGEWKIDVGSVDAAIDDAFKRWNVWRLNADPYFWSEQIATWAGRYDKPGNRRVVSWATTNLKKTAFAIQEYRNAINEGQVTHAGDADFTAGIENAYKQQQFFRDDKGEPMWTIRKEHPRSPLKIDPAMGAALSWEARSAALASGALNQNTWHGIYIPE